MREAHEHTQRGHLAEAKQAQGVPPAAGAGARNGMQGGVVPLRHTRALRGVLPGAAGLPPAGRKGWRFATVRDRW